LVRSLAQHFTDLVVIAERIEQAIGLGKIVDPTKEKDFTRKRKKLRFTIPNMVTKAKEKTTKNTYPSYS
jgi:hypothetical protein